MIKFWGKKAKAWMSSCHVVEICGIESLHKMCLFKELSIYSIVVVGAIWMVGIGLGSSVVDLLTI